LADDLPPLNGDRVQLQQVISPVAECKRCHERGEDRPRDLVIAPAPTELMYNLSVRETGIGVDAG